MATSKGPALTMDHNRQLAAIFRHMADCYRYLGNAERFRAIAYDNAAKTIANLDEPVAIYQGKIKQLDELPGVGESIAQKIDEYLRTGKIETFEQLIKKVPFPLLELLDVGGIGPATLRLLHESLSISNRDELVSAILAGKLRGIPGLGEKKISNMRMALKIPEAKQRMPWATAHKIGTQLVAIFKKIGWVQQVALAGSLRRKTETVGDIDIIITAPHLFRKRIMRKISTLPEVGRLLAAGATKISLLLKKNGVQVDVRMVHDDEFGAALLYFTGSKVHNIQLRSLAKQRGWKINEYGVFDQKGKKMAGKTEESIYELLGLSFIPPAKRVGGKEIEAAMQ